VSPLRGRRAVDPLAGALDPVYPPPPPEQAEPQPRPVDPAPRPGRRRQGANQERSGLLRRFGRALADFRRRVVPLPDEVIEEFIGHGERVIHSDHPSFRSFAVENGLLFLGLFAVGILFLGILFDGSAMVSGLLLLGLAIVLLVLVLKRLEDRYTSYVVTDARIMRIRGIVSRRAHSIPWVRVTDLTLDQSLAGRVFGYATLHIESANEDSGLRDLEGVSDPMLFNQYVVDMVVAKQGTTVPAWVVAGEPPPPSVPRGLRRVRMSRRRRGEAAAEGERTGVAEAEPRADRARIPGTRTVRRAPGATTPTAPAPAATQPAPAATQPAEPARPDGARPYDVEKEVAELEELSAETIAARLRHSSDPALRWADDDRPS
jgi:membrane protein YdbS with pleckstrin-like domain